MFTSFSLKISNIQCIENNVFGWEKLFMNKFKGLVLLEQKYSQFFCSFFSVVNKYVNTYFKY